MKFETIYPRDMIALAVIIGCFILLALGFNGWVQGVAALIIGYYFSKRMYEENHKEKKK